MIKEKGKALFKKVVEALQVPQYYVRLDLG